MKKIKKGFTIAEILLCLCIIGIISSMGIVATKHSADRAYNLFFYSGYINLYNTIMELKGNDELANIENLAKYLGTANNNTITTINGISYDITFGATGEVLGVEMKVPQRKTRNNDGIATSQFRVTEINNITYLIPMAGGNINLQNRRDLLPAYIDDGTVGRVKKEGESYTIQKTAYYTYRQAFCALNSEGIVGVISCADVEGIPNNTTGVLKVADPRKAR